MKKLTSYKNQINQFYVNAKKVIEDQDVAKSNRLKIIRVKNFRFILTVSGVC